MNYKKTLLLLLIPLKSNSGEKCCTFTKPSTFLARNMEKVLFPTCWAPKGILMISYGQMSTVNIGTALAPQIS